MHLDRVLHSSVVFPVEYGFVPQTWSTDEDPLDIMILSYEPLEVGCIVKVRVIGVLIMEDEKGDDLNLFYSEHAYHRTWSCPRRLSYRSPWLSLGRQ